MVLMLSKYLWDMWDKSIHSPGNHSATGIGTAWTALKGVPEENMCVVESHYATGTFVHLYRVYLNTAILMYAVLWISDSFGHSI